MAEEAIPNSHFHAGTTSTDPDAVSTMRSSSSVTTVLLLTGRTLAIFSKAQILHRVFSEVSRKSAQTCTVHSSVPEFLSNLPGRSNPEFVVIIRSHIK